MVPKIIRCFIGAVANSNLDLAKQLIIQDPSIVNRKVTKTGKTNHKKPIYYALRRSNTAMFNLLIENGAEIDQSDIIDFLSNDITILPLLSYKFITEDIDTSKIISYNQQELKDALFKKLFTNQIESIVPYYKFFGFTEHEAIQFLNKFDIIYDKFGDSPYLYGSRQSKSEIISMITSIRREFKMNSLFN
jgi:hypothetical protein